VDVGGTFTDLVALVDGELVTAKVPSTPADQSEGAMRAVEAAGLKPGDIAVFAHGMTSGAARAPRSSRPRGFATCSRSPARIGRRSTT
jgi:N-methylhydantoinase A/oxoprolinase/acetone carboxylase beta subunit